MLEMDLLLEAFRQRRERLEELGREGEVKRRSPKEKITDPSVAEVAERILATLESTPDVRRERVEEIKRKIQDGTLDFDSRSVADCMLQESILNELL